MPPDHSELERSIVRIYAANAGIAGAGFFVDEQHILTCAHVITSAFNLSETSPEPPQDDVDFDLPFIAAGQKLKARVVLWKPLSPASATWEGDVAGLAIINGPVAGVQGARIISLDDLWRHDFMAYGFPANYPNGLWASGRTIAVEATGWLQIDAGQDPSLFVQQGFSGAPLWDKIVGGVTGMVVARVIENERAAFAISIQKLVNMWPAILSPIKIEREHEQAGSGVNHNQPTETGQASRKDLGILRSKLFELLKDVPYLDVPGNRDAWLSRLPRSLRKSLRRSENTYSDLALILDDVEQERFQDGRWALLELMDAAFTWVAGLETEGKLRQLRTEIESALTDSKSSVFEVTIQPENNPVTGAANRNELNLPLAQSEEESDRQKWLTDLGIVVDPFSDQSQSGADDPELLRYYYRPPYFNKILGSVQQLDPLIVLGVEGSGKSSLRSAVAQMARSSMILPVVYHNLEDFTSPELLKSQGLAMAHIGKIIREALNAVADDLDRERIHQIDRTPANEMLRNLIYSYATEFIRGPVRLRHFKQIFQPGAVEAEKLPDEPRELLGEFCFALCDLFGYQAIYILVDPDVSPPEFDPQLLKPLLASYGLLHLPEYKVAFKFFLDSSYQSLLDKIPWTTRTQARMDYYRLEWTPDLLRKLLRERLRLCGSGELPGKPGGVRRSPLVSLGQISEAPDLDEIVIRHSSNPRELVALGRRLFAAHLAHGYDPQNPLIAKKTVDAVLQESAYGQGLLASQLLERIGNRAESVVLDARILERLIEQGENQHVEFKESLRINKKSGGADDRLTQSIIRELCGFLNHEGGFLLIGIADDGQVVGLSKDIQSLGKKNEDGFQLAISDAIASYLDPPLNPHITFVDLKGQRVCVIQVDRGRRPYYCRTEGQQTCTYYVRIGNSTRVFDAKRQTVHMLARFSTYLSTQLLLTPEAPDSPRKA